MKELLRYRLALIQYQISDKLPILKKLFKTQFGLCYHFNYNIFSEDPIFVQLRTLWNVRPNSTDEFGYWFERGEIKPRIELLKEAIKQKQL